MPVLNPPTRPRRPAPTPPRDPRANNLAIVNRSQSGPAQQEPWEEDEPTLVRDGGSSRSQPPSVAPKGAKKGSRWHLCLRASTRELERMIEMGVASPGALAWKPGWYAWTPVHEVPELQTAIDRSGMTAHPGKRGERSTLLPPPSEAARKSEIRPPQTRLVRPSGPASGTLGAASAPAGKSQPPPTLRTTRHGSGAPGRRASPSDRGAPSASKRPPSSAYAAPYAHSVRPPSLAPGRPGGPGAKADRDAAQAMPVPVPLQEEIAKLRRDGLRALAVMMGVMVTTAAFGALVSALRGASASAPPLTANSRYYALSSALPPPPAQALAPSPPVVAPASVAAISRPPAAAPAVALTPDPNQADKPNPKKERKGHKARGKFENRAAKRALRLAMQMASVCIDKGSTASGSVSVAFAPSGTALGAAVNSTTPLSAKAARCVRGAFERVRVPAFRGESVTVRKSFRLER